MPKHLHAVRRLAREEPEVTEGLRVGDAHALFPRTSREPRVSSLFPSIRLAGSSSGVRDVPRTTPMLKAIVAEGATFDVVAISSNFRCSRQKTSLEQAHVVPSDREAQQKTATAKT